MKPLNAHLFLKHQRARRAQRIARGRACRARVPRNRPTRRTRTPDEVRIAFDGDAVLFSDEAERVFQRDGLAAFQKHETPTPPRR